MINKEINIPKISILETELIINNNLYKEGIISEIQYAEVNKIIYDKINKLKNKA